MSSGINDGFYLTDKWKTQIQGLEEQLNGSWTTRTYSHAGRLVPADSIGLVDSIEYSKGELIYSESIRNRTLVWTAGFHLYNILDCYTLYNRRKGLPDEPGRDPKGALIRSLLIPGWGQLYNGAYAKFGLLFMAAAGFGANIHGWNRTAGYYAGLSSRYDDLARSLGLVLSELAIRSGREKAVVDAADLKLKDSLSLSAAQIDSLKDVRAGADSLYKVLEGERNNLDADQGRLSGRADRFRREKETYYSWRNQNIWYCVAVYFYAAFDAYVDAHLSGFDRRLDIALVPGPDGGTLRLTCPIGN